MLTFYIACTIITLILLITVVMLDEISRQNQIFMAILTMASNVGYLTLAASTSLTEALLATKLTYIGGMFGPLFFFSVIHELCGVKVKKKIYLPLFLVQFALYLLVWTIGYNDWYYKDIVFVRENGVAFLQKGYGPGHTLYLISILGYVLATLIVSIGSIRRKNKISTRNIGFLLFTMVFAIAVSRLEKLIGGGMEIMPLVYIVFEFGVYFVIYNINIYSVDRNVSFESQEKEAVGYVILNSKLRYMGCNEYMRQVIPEISTFNLEEPIPEDNILAQRIIPRAKALMEKRGEVQTGGGESQKDAEKLIQNVAGESQKDAEELIQNVAGESQKDAEELIQNVAGESQKDAEKLLRNIADESQKDVEKQDRTAANRQSLEDANWQQERQKESLITIDNHIFRFVMVPLKNMRGRVYAYRLSIEDVTDRQRYFDMIHDYNRNLEQEVKGKTHRIREIQQKTLLGMAQMVESRDLSTGGHIKRTSLVVSVFSKALLKTDLGLDKAFLNYVERSAPMHDLGKIAVDDQILRKQGKFTDEEYEEMKKHSAAGAKIVSDILRGIEEEEFVKIATNVAHYHHEKVNGKGYPEGLVGDQIPVEARIMALADVFDALVSKRCYKEAFTYDRAFNIISEDSGTHFDEKLAAVFISCRTELEALYNSFANE